MSFSETVTNRIREGAESAVAAVLALRRSVVDTRSLEGPICVNLGSASQAAPGWVNLDRTVNVLIDRIAGAPRILHMLGLLSSQQYQRFGSGQWRSVRFWDAASGIPVSDGTADYVYTSHFLEHLDRATAAKVLAESFRILKPFGVLRVVVPDMFRIASEYVDAMRTATPPSSLEDEVAYLSVTMALGQVPDAFAGQFFESTHVRQRLFGHRWMYDRWSLSAALRHSGFVDIVERQFRQGEVPDLDVLDMRPTNSLHIEARKPAVART
jgi:predicted SAM-dependent methyltransferase